MIYYKKNSRENLMNIAIDIDDTLTNSFEYFQPFVSEFFGVTVAELKKRNISYGNLPAEWKSRELEFFRTYYDKVVPQTTFKPAAKDGVNFLRSLGHKIFIVTARTTDFYTDPYKTTAEELNNGGIIYDKLICSFDKAAACRENKISVLIDDMPHNCEAAQNVGIVPVLFNSKANINANVAFRRVNDWKEAVRVVEGIRQSIAGEKIRTNN